MFPAAVGVLWQSGLRDPTPPGGPHGIEGLSLAFEKPSPVTALTQELRFATTMTGGVSLAIWMAGVTREINLLAQASQWRRLGGTFPTNSQLTNESAASLRLYAQLIDLLDMVVDVDILSGTSAGGINAALLASSRVTGSDLGGIRDLWLDLGALTELLRDPRDKKTPSLLYGDERIFAALAKRLPKLATGPFPPTTFPEAARTPSTTLYITTTLLAGETSRFTDSFGTLVQDVDRRGLFTFTETDLARPDTAPALALAARSSASFPLAFEPSFLPFTKGTAKKGEVPARPAMAPFTSLTRPHWVSDGGLLDNRPIGVLFKRIFDRPARRPVRRVLLFVVPSSGPAPDPMHEPPPDNVDEPLGLIDGLLKGLAAVTTQSIAADLRAIRAHQDCMEARTDAKLRLAELAATLRNGTRLLTPSLLTDYRTREATKQAQTLTSALLRRLSTCPPESGPATESLPKSWSAELTVGGDADKVCRQQITATILLSWSQPTAQPLPQSPAELARFGQPAYDLAKGCALTVIRAAFQLARSDADIAALAEVTEAIHRAWRPTASSDLSVLVRTMCSRPAIRQGSLENAADQLAADYLQQSTVPGDAWERLGAALVNAYPTLTQLAASASADSGAPTDSLLARDHVAAGQLETYLSYLGTYPGRADDSRDAPTMAWKLFDLATTQRAMLPADAEIEQGLELVQVSADTRSLLAPDWQTAQQKLTGMRLHHFGAFYKRSWRANDWMWGRLDGAGWLVHVLLDPRRVRWIVGERADTNGPQSGAQWFLGKLKELGAPDFPSPGYPLPASWIGSSAGLMVAAASPYVAWMSVTAGQAELTAAQVRVAAAAYETAYGLTVPPPVIAENRAELMILIATNLLGQNTPAIAVNEAEYGEMWAQDAAAMFGYAAATATATATLLPFEEAPEMTSAGGLLEQAAAVEEASDTAAANQLMNNVPQALQQLAQPTQGTTPSSKLGGLWKTVSPHRSPISNMVSMANNHMSMTNSGVSMTNTLSSMLKGFAPAAAAQAVQTAAQNGVRAMSSLGSSLGSSGLGGGVAANLGRAASVGSLSVPQAWAAANQAVTPAARALPLTSLTSAAERGPGQMLGGLPVGQMGARAGGGLSGVLRVPPRPYVMPHSPAAG
ncbi:transmembrane protein [Mycobacterium tuberculosis]|nr:transmembrane protein [Mycobacterium tuberculosis]